MINSYQVDPHKEIISDELNQILIECAKLRGCYPLMHRTLNEFNWFTTVVIFGWTSLDQYRMDESISKGCGTIEEWQEQKSKYQNLYIKYNDVYVDCEYDQMLIKMAQAFKEYCEEEYANDPRDDY